MAYRPGIGRFAGSITPQEPSRPVTTQLLDTLSAAGVHTARSRAGQSKVYTGTGISFQAFVRTMGGTNSLEALDVHAAAPLKRNRSRALGQSRGLPFMAEGFLDA